MNERPDGVHEIVCSECEKAYAVVNPNFSEIERPVCPGCRDSARFLNDDDEEG